MKDLLYAIVEDLVEDKDSIKITEDAPNEEGVIVLHLNVAPDDMYQDITPEKVEKALGQIDDALNGVDVLVRPLPPHHLRHRHRLRRHRRPARARRI